MPTYTYECEKCGQTQSQIHSMKDDPEIICPKCKTKCFRVIQPVYGYVKGNCYFNKKDCKKQATLATLKECDPYKKCRQPGETDELISRLKRNKLKF